MPPSNSPADDRLASLERTALLDSAPEVAFDRLTALACRLLKAPVALVSLVDAERQFFKSQCGLPAPLACARETPLSRSFCKHVVASGEPLVVCDARADPLVQNSPAVEEFNALSYLGIPLKTSEGHTLGSFCVLDFCPRQWTEEEIENLTDLTVSVVSEIELRISAAQLRDNNQRLREAEALRSDLSSMIVHDLRTPLNSLMGGLQAIEQLGELNSEQSTALEIALRGGRGLMELVSDLLDISKIESGALRLKLQPVMADDLVERAWNQIADLSHKQTATREIAPDLPEFPADKSKLVRVLVNLLGNALKFSSQRATIALHVGLGQDQQIGRAIIFSVRDQGSGIAPENLERIFDKFGQVEKGASSRSSSGLGLTFCKMIVEAHNGRIWVESEVGKGSTFSFAIPAPKSS